MHVQLALALIELQEYQEAERQLLLAADAEEQDDLAQARIEQGHGVEALPLVDEAGTLLERQGADFHLAALAVLRSQCVNASE